MTTIIHFDTADGMVRVTGDDEGTVILHPSSPLAQTITTAAEEALSFIGGGTTSLVDGDGDWWVFQAPFWHCLGPVDEENFLADTDDLIGSTAFRGLDSWVDIEATYRLQEV